MRISWKLLRDTDWDLTLRVALTRGFFTGIVIVALSFFGSAPPLWLIPLIPPMWALAAVPLGLFLNVVALAISMIPGSGIVVGATMLVGSLAVCAGDPAVYLLNRTYPGLLAVRDMKLFNFSPMFFVLKPSV